MLIHTERRRRQAVPVCVSSCGIYSGNLVSLFRNWAINQKRKSLPFSVITMCLTDIISPETTCGTSAIEMQIWKKKRKKKKHTAGVANISILLILELGGWRTVWYHRYPTVCSPEEQWCGLKQWGNKPTSRVCSTACHSPFFFSTKIVCVFP